MYLSTKYESEQRIYKVPTIVILANFKPDTSKVSGDRWNILHTEYIENTDHFLSTTHNNSKGWLTKGSIYNILKIFIDMAFKNLVFRELDKYFMYANPISHYGIYTL